MKVQRTFRSIVALATLGSVLVACSGGGDQTANTVTPRTNTGSNNTNTVRPPVTTPPITQGPTNVGASGNETIDDVKTQNDQILQKLGQVQNSVNEANSNAKKAKDNSSWAKWLGIGIAGAMALSMINKGVRTGKEKGWLAGLGGFIFNDDSGANDSKADKRAESTDANVTRFGSANLAATTATGAAGVAKTEEVGNKLGQGMTTGFSTTNSNMGQGFKGVNQGMSDGFAEVSRQNGATVQAIRGEGNQTRATVAREASQIRTTLTNQTNLINAHKQLIDKNAEDIRKARADVDALGQKLVRSEEEINALKTTQAQATAKLATIESNIGALTQAQTTLTNDLRDLDGRSGSFATLSAQEIARLKADIETQRQEIMKVLGQLNEQKGSLNVLIAQSKNMIPNNPAQASASKPDGNQNGTAPKNTGTPAAKPADILNNPAGAPAASGSGS